MVALALVAGAMPSMRAYAAASSPTTTAPKSSSTSSSSSSSSSSSQLKTLSNKIAEASTEEASLVKKIDDANARKASATAKLADITKQLPTAQAALDDATKKLSSVDSELAIAESELATANARLRGGTDALKRRAIEAYMGQPDSSALAVGVHVSTFREYVALREYIKAVAHTHVKVVDHYDDLQRAAASLEDTVARRRAEAKAQRDEVARQTNALATAKSTQESLKAQADSAAADAANLLKQVRSKKSLFQSQYNALKAQSDAIARQLKSRQSNQGPAPSGHGVLSVPIPGAPITDYFGPRVHPIFGDVRMHTGIDFGASEGTPIHAAADGVVVSAGVLGGYGNATIIDHGNSLATLYAHQSRMIVSAGQSVKRGQVIGYVGHTGYATGPHLHFEVRVDGTPVDPMKYL